MQTFHLGQKTNTHTHTQLKPGTAAGYGWQYPQSRQVQWGSLNMQIKFNNRLNRKYLEAQLGASNRECTENSRVLGHHLQPEMEFQSRLWFRQMEGGRGWELSSLGQVVERSWCHSFSQEARRPHRPQTSQGMLKQRSLITLLHFHVQDPNSNLIQVSWNQANYYLWV